MSDDDDECGGCICFFMTGVLGCIRLRNAARVLLHDRWSGMHRSRVRPGCFFMTGVLGCIGLRNAARVLLREWW